VLVRRAGWARATKGTVEVAVLASDAVCDYCGDKPIWLVYALLPRGPMKCYLSCRDHVVKALEHAADAEDGGRRSRREGAAT